jgi:N-acetylglucosaminyl-diphospho-decaprenol L-rhamnosyltransferase
MYFDDVSLRARRSGAKTYFLKEARVFHEGNVGSDHIPGIRLYYSLRSRLRFARSYYSPWRATVLLVLTFTVERAARLLRGLVRRDGAEVSSTNAGYTKLLRDLLLSTTSRDQRHSGGAVGSV